MSDELLPVVENDGRLNRSFYRGECAARPQAAEEQPRQGLQITVPLRDDNRRQVR